MATRAIFAGADASGNTNLWVTDGTAAGTSELTAVGAASGLNPSGITILGTKALFQGIDASSRYELWVSDGTSGGTTELTPAGANSLGLFGPDGLLNPDFTPLGGKLLIQGYDASGRWGLWVTDGTAAGTNELTVAGADAEGLFSGAIFPDFTVVGNKALFMGEDPRGFTTLWVTDGTSVGTSELTVAGANSPYGVLNNGDPDFTRLGNKVIFEGENANDFYGLWVTDGTAAGTKELTVAGASSFGVASRSFSVLGAKALFIGMNATNQSGLWVTDGTSAGTSELAGGNIFNGLLTPDPHFTVLGSKMLFMGTDANDHLNLWVTDGTAAGTSQLAVAGAYSLGLLADDVLTEGLNHDTDFFSFGAKAVFKGMNASGQVGLWVTDGTAAGTSELLVAGAYSGGLFNSANDPDFTALGGKALFLGSDASGRPSLWITDGTAAGTSEVAVPGAYTGGSGLSPHDITALPPPPTPVTIATNGVTSLVQLGSQYELQAVSSGTGPFLTYNGSAVTAGEFPGWTPVGAAKTATGYEVAWSLLGANEYTVWNTDSNGAYTGAATGVLSGASYALQRFEPSFGEDLNGDRTIGPTVTKPPATSDFNKDGFSDILWQNMDGQASIWDMNGNTLIGGGAVTPNPGPNWHAVGTGDFNHDGHSDILWQNVSGQASIWEMNSNTLIGGGPVSPNPGPAWKAIGTGDFTGDGFSDDILWQNANGQAAIWEMKGNALKGGGPVSPNPGPSWRAVGTGDFNGDGDSDILWQNANGQVSIWEMNGNSLMGGGPVSPNPGPNWKAIGTGDFNGDGLSDILFQNKSSGQVSIWDMNGNKLIGGGPVSPNPGPAWKAIGTGDFNSDGLPDILFQNTTSGQASIWDMSGTRLVGGGPVSPNPGPGWHATA